MNTNIRRKPEKKNSQCITLLAGEDALAFGNPKQTAAINSHSIGRLMFSSIHNVYSLENNIRPFVLFHKAPMERSWPQL